MIGRALVTAALACSLGCSLPWKLPERAARPDVAPPETRFAVLPLNTLVPIARELTGSTDRVFGRMSRYLSASGHERYWIEERDARRLWLESMAIVEASDSMAHDFESAIRIFAGKLGASTSFDALVVASLVYRSARLIRGMVKWDGTSRRIPKIENEALRVPESYRTTVSALSLHVMVFDADGDLVFENYGGLDLAHSFSTRPGHAGVLDIELRETILLRERYINEGVELAFEPYVPRPPSERW
jgi:hypothetical protein